MSLIHWWPLNGNLNDQGILSLNLSGQGSIGFTNSGKIGKGASFTSDSHNLKATDLSTLTALTKYSMSCWVYLSNTATNHSSSFLSSGNWNSGNAQVCFGLYNYSSGYNTLLVPNKSSWNNGINLTTKIQLGVWHHYAIVYDGSTTKGYIDGTYVGSYNGGGISSTDVSYYYLGAATYYFGFTMKGTMNDFRIYDHALSAKEVKEISKGLVLHYNFEDEYIESTTNIDPARSTAPSFSYAATKEKVIFRGKECWHFIIENNGSIWSYSSANGYAENSVLTRSCWLYIPSGQTNRAGWYGLPFAFEGMKSISNRRVYDLNKMDTWQYCYCTGTAQSTSSNYLLYMLADGSATAHRIEFYITDIQLEEKDHATPYVNGTRNGEKVYDSSGYGNNGTINGNIQISSDSINGQHSVKFDGIGTTYIYETITPQYTKNITFNVWCYQESASSPQSEQYIFSQGRDNYPSGFNIISSSGIAQIQGVFGSVSSGVNIVGGWHMITGTYDGATVKCYVDGVLKNSMAYTNDLTYTYAPAVTLGKMAFDYTNSGYYFMFKGKIADAKIYATALSEDDVKAEYNRKAAIDRNGNLFTGEIIETTYNLLTSENLLNGRVNTSATSNVGEIVTRNNYPAYRISPVPYWSGDGATSKNICKGQFGPGQYIFDLWIDVDEVYYDGNGQWVPGGFEVYYTDGSVENIIIDANSTQGHSGYQHLIRKTNANKTISGLGVYYYIGVPIYIRCDSVICKVNSDGKICKNNIIAGGQFVEPAVSDSKCKLTRYGVVSNAIKEL